MEPKGVNHHPVPRGGQSKAHLKGVRARPASARRQDQLAALRAHIQSQIRQWDEELGNLRARVDAIEEHAHQRIEALTKNMNADMKSSGAASAAAAAGGAGNTARQAQLSHDRMQVLLGQWRSELGEIRANACRADTEARHAYQHQINTLRRDMDRRMQEWQRALQRLHSQSDAFWSDILSGELEATWHKLNALDEASPDAWQGFSADIDLALREIELRAFRGAGAQNEAK